MPHTGVNPEPTSLIYIGALVEPEPPGSAGLIRPLLERITSFSGGGAFRVCGIGDVTPPPPLRPRKKELKEGKLKIKVRDW